MSEIKLIFTGTPGAGKTTAIGAISEIPPVTTDMAATDELTAQKAETTVAMDFGEISLEDGQKLRLYGTPGQRRFEFMWRILAEGGLGLIVLIDNTRPEPLQDLSIYLDNFADFIRETGAVVGVTRTDLQGSPSVDDYYDFLASRGEMLPVFEADVRKKDDVLMLLDALISTLEFA